MTAQAFRLGLAAEHDPQGAAQAITAHASRLGLIAGHDPQSAALVRRLLRLSVRVLPQALVDGEFAFTLSGTRGPDGGWRLRPVGTSPRSGAIAALGLLRLPEPVRREVLAGADCDDLIGRLAKRLDNMTSHGDVALLCWAAAEARHSELPHALDRLAELDRRADPQHVAAAAWIVTALVAARPHADVERHLAAARHRLLAARGAVYPHLIGGAASWYRTVGSFADQAYPVQALARLHGSADDPEALAAADSVAAAICRAQGKAGQWRWHYDDAPAASSTAIRCTASTSMRWRRWRCLTWPTPAARSTWTLSAAGCGGWRGHPRPARACCSMSRRSPGAR